MKRLFFPFLAALSIHWLLLGLKGEWLITKQPPHLRPAPMDIALVRLRPEKPAGPRQATTPEAEAVEKKTGAPPDGPSTVKRRKNHPPDGSSLRQNRKETAETGSSQDRQVKKAAQKPESLPMTPAPESFSYPEKAGSESKPFDSLPKTESPSTGIPAPIFSSISPPAGRVHEAIPMYRDNPPPEYPSTARRRGYRGTVMLEVFVEKTGKVGDLRVLQSSGHSSLDEAAVSCVAGWRFEPGSRGDEKVAMWVKVPISFQLRK